MPSLPRSECPECYRNTPLRSGGQLRKHRDQNGCFCPASGLTIKQAQIEIDRALERFRREVTDAAAE
jgi:hypothetical protein